jgi:ABC-2 type transport system permease protein
MDLKRYSFNVTVYLRNIRQFWPIWISYSLYCFITLPLKLLNGELDPQRYEFERQNGITALSLAEWQNDTFAGIVEYSIHPSSIFLFSCIGAIAVFSYLYQTRNAHMFHSLPITRESYFLTNCISGLSFMIIPQIAIFIISLFVCLAKQLSQTQMLLEWFLVICGMTFFAFALAVFTALLTGNAIFAVVFYLIINSIYILFYYAVNGAAYIMLYGISDQIPLLSKGMVLSPYFLFDLLASNAPNGWYETHPYDVFHYCDLFLSYIPGYCLAALCLYVIANKLYQKRHLETAGDITAFPIIKLFLRWSVSILGGGFCGYLVFSSLWGDMNSRNNHLAFLSTAIILGSLITFWGINYLFEKKILLCKKRWRELGLLLLLWIVSFSSLEMDFFGFETRIPAVDEIKSLTINDYITLDIATADYQKILDLHQQIIAAKDEVKSEKDVVSWGYLSIDYTLKNDNELHRSYAIPTDSTNPRFLKSIEMLEQICNNKTYYMDYIFGKQYKSLTPLGGDFVLYDTQQNQSLTNINEDGSKVIFTAIQKDISEGNFQIYLKAAERKMNTYQNILTFYYLPSSENQDAAIDSERLTLLTDTGQSPIMVNLTVDCIHTLNALRELNILTDDKQLLTEKECEDLGLAK